jgi:putative lipoic acid-binding regulatory protein
MAEDQWESFKVKLEETHQWPCPYTFKCIVRAEYYCELDAIKEKGEHSVRQSSNGKYLSLTLNFEAQESDDVLEVYRLASAIPGAVLL